MSGAVVVFVGPGLPREGLPLPAGELEEFARSYADALRLDRSRIGAQSWRWLELADAVAAMSAGAQIRGILLPAARRVALNEWARAQGVAPSTARRWADSGRLASADKRNGRWTVDETEPKPKG